MRVLATVDAGLADSNRSAKAPGRPKEPNNDAFAFVAVVAADVVVDGISVVVLATLIGAKSKHRSCKSASAIFKLPSSNVGKTGRKNAGAAGWGRLGVFGVAGSNGFAAVGGVTGWERGFGDGVRASGTQRLANHPVNSAVALTFCNARRSAKLALAATVSTDALRLHDSVIGGGGVAVRDGNSGDSGGVMRVL